MDPSAEEGGPSRRAGLTEGKQSAPVGTGPIEGPSATSAATTPRPGLRKLKAVERALCALSGQRACLEGSDDYGEMLRRVGELILEATENSGRLSRGPNEPNIHQLYEQLASREDGEMLFSRPTLANIWKAYCELPSD